MAVELWYPRAIRDPCDPSLWGSHADAGEPKFLLHTTEGGLGVYHPDPSTGPGRRYYGNTGTWPNFTLAINPDGWRVYQHVPANLPGMSLRNRPGGVQTNINRAASHRCNGPNARTGLYNCFMGCSTAGSGDEMVVGAEEWRPCPLGYEEHYEVSSYGRVRRVGRSRGTKPGTVRKLQLGIHGYLQISLRKLGEPAARPTVHKLVCLAFHGPRPGPDYEVSHIDHDKTNNHASNLKWATHGENILHTYRSGRRTFATAARGESVNTAKLTPVAVMDIRRRATQGERGAVLAREFGVSSTTIYKIIDGRAWRHVAA